MINEKNVNEYCIKEQIHLIENYELAMQDETQTWDCHHRREIDENKSKQQLIDANLYYDRPASELIFLTKEEHISLHQKGENNIMYGKTHSDDARQKISDTHKGKQLSAETKAKISASKKGKPGTRKGKHHTDEARQKISESKKGKPKKKYRWVTIDGEIVEMAINHSKRYHPDWILLID